MLWDNTSFINRIIHNNLKIYAIILDPYILLYNKIDVSNLLYFLQKPIYHYNAFSIYLYTIYIEKLIGNLKVVLRNTISLNIFLLNTKMTAIFYV